MAIACFGQSLTNYMVINNITNKLGKFVWIISPIRKTFFKISLLVISIAILREKGRMDSGEMMFKYKPSHKYMLDPFKSMYSRINPSEHFMRITKITILCPSD
jgi:hypothetical protein